MVVVALRNMISHW